MATSLQTLVSRTRRYLRDWPDYDTITASLASTGTTVTVADETMYAARWTVQVDSETMIIRSTSANHTLTVLRAARGSTAASHASGASVFIRPAFDDVEIVDALNQGIDNCFPYFYRPVLDTSITTTDSTYEYTVPNLPGTYDTGSQQIPYVTKLEIKQTSDLTYRELRRWQIVAAPNGSRLIKLRTAEPAGGTMRVTGFGPFPHLVNLTDTLDASWPERGHYLPAIYAAGSLLMSGEAGRDRVDTGSIDRREEANRGGLSLSTGVNLLQRFQRETIQLAMPPLPRHFRQPV